MKRGQSALEYLLTYGWALLIIIIVGAALFAMGILNPATYQQKSCTGFQLVNYQEHRVGTNGKMTLVVLNGAGRDITIDAIEVLPEGGSAQSVLSGGSLTMAPEEKAVLETDQIVGWSGTLGKQYKGKVVIFYDTPDVVSHSTSAVCTGKLE